ncbi:MAG: helix-hairpin-helix domain-containing protein [Desulfuromonadales bacterium]|nr:helix-hairpin-helix domain-containing protein [Desulfuromonadales bacterium]MBN2791306.1 helix-hairpin-helix domain-containing protein [Desulfuromonadales bacterium]
MKSLKSYFVFFALLVTLSFACQPAFTMEKINLNTATIEQLMELKGIGEKTAEKIIEYRKQHQFKSVDELVNVKGVGEKTLTKIRDQLTVEENKKK